MSESKVIPDELKSLIGVDLKTHFLDIEKGYLKRFAEAIGDPDPLWQSVAPPTLFLTFGPKEVNDDYRPAWNKSSLHRILNGGNEIEYYEPVKAGDVISCTGKLVEVYEKEGKTGKMLFTVSEVVYKNQKGKTVAKARYTFIRY